MESKPLKDLTVVDCSSLIAGPMAGMFMADFGAEVIKVEHPEVGDAARGFGREDQDLVWKWLGRNKQSVAIDLHEAEGQALFVDLISDADILIESFRPDTLEDWGIGWETLSAENPDLIMVRTTGFGQTGPYTDRPGFGTLAESMSGFAEVTGFPDKPPTLPSLGLADGIAACFSTFAAMFAVYWRDVAGGTGQYIDTSLVEPLFGMMGRITVDHAVNGNIPTRTGNRSDFTAPRNTYRTKDDKWVAMSASAETIAKRILRTVGGEELATDPRFQSNEARVDRVDELDEIIQDWIGERTRDEVVRLFNENEAAVAPVYNIEDIFNDSFFRERDALVDVDDPEYDDLVLPGVFPHMSETPGDVEHAGPPLGEHTIDVLAAYTDADTETLRELDRESVVHIHD